MIILSWFYVILFCINNGFSAIDEMENETYALFDTLLDASRYDKRIKPAGFKGGPTEVAIDLYIRSISSVDELAMDFDIDLLIRQHWVDQRLEYDKFNVVESDNDFVTGTPEVAEKIWRPDLFFANEKRAYFHEVTKPNMMLRLFPDGQIMYSSRYSLELSCDMHFELFPFDTQECIIQLGSFSFTTKSLIFNWKELIPITLNYDLKLPKFYLNDIRNVPCRNEHYTGNFSCLKAQFTLCRQLGYHFIQSYIPIILLVCASWISFWLDADAIPARITLGVTSVLTTTAKGSSIQNALPPVSYMKAIDVWIGTCTFFVFAALLEFAIVNVTARMEVKRAMELHRTQNCYIQPRNITNRVLFCAVTSEQGFISVRTDDDDPAEKKLLDSHPEQPYSDKSDILYICELAGKSKAKKIDLIARVVFPVAFLVFIGCYIYFYMFLKV